MKYYQAQTPAQQRKMLNKHKKSNAKLLEELARKREECIEEIKQMERDEKQEREREIVADLVAGKITVGELLGAEAMEMIEHYKTTGSLESTLRRYCGEYAALNIARGLQSEDTQERYAHTKLVSDVLVKAEAEREKQKVIDVGGAIDISPVDEEILKEYMQSRGV